MNISKFEDWKKSVTQLNDEARNIIHDRDELYRFIADEVKLAFEKMDLYPENVHITPSANEVQVEFKAGDNVVIDPNCLVDLHMNFRVSYGYNDRGNWRVILIFYPFKD